MSQTATIAVNSALPPYRQIPETTRELEWADLITLDLANFDQPGGKQELTDKLFEAVQKIARIFYVINFGLTQAQVDRQFAIGKELFSLPAETKLQFRADIEQGGYNGYKPLGLREVLPGKFDNTEIYNIPKFTPNYAMPHPSIIQQHWNEIEQFSRHIADNVVPKLLVLFAMVLELPEDYFLKNHRYSEPSDCHLRYMKYHRRTNEENEELNNVWIKGHTDFGSLTLLFRQPMASLQILTPEGTWKYVKPYPESITVNLADILHFLTNGFLRSSVHRVVTPPQDQQQYDRYGVLYFVRSEDDLELTPVKSKVLERLGYDQVVDNLAVGITAGEWVRARVRTNATRTPGRDDPDQNIIGNVKATFYDWKGSTKNCVLEV